jgi:hypothetical protein
MMFLSRYWPEGVPGSCMDCTAAWLSVKMVAFRGVGDVGGFWQVYEMI